MDRHETPVPPVCAAGLPRRAPLVAALAVANAWPAPGLVITLVGYFGLLFAVLPALLTTALQRAVARWLPKNLFIFIIGNGMFVTLAATALTSVLLLLLSLGLAVLLALRGHGAEAGGPVVAQRELAFFVRAQQQR